ncbi:MAG: bifunctional nuclease family protein [Bacillota bacterium]|nr:bifunctional nuclease family protein [Bacillota bacterium]
MKPVRVERLGMDMVSDQVVVFLKELDGDRSLPIWIGHLEAGSIALALEGVQPPRPITHDLLKSMLEAVGARVKRVAINELRNETFYALIEIEADGHTFEVDSRPSDALALALRAEAPIFVAEQVLEQAGVRSSEGEQSG